MKQEKLLEKILQDNQAKITLPRRLVFRLLLKHGPQSLAELVRSSSKKIDRVSVYRTADLFEKLGIVRRVTIGWKYKLELSDIFLDHHHHITCLGCHKIMAVHEDASLAQAIDQLASGTGFVVTTHHLELQGYCHVCKKPRLHA